GGCSSNSRVRSSGQGLAGVGDPASAGRACSTPASQPSVCPCRVCSASSSSAVRACTNSRVSSRDRDRSPRPISSSCPLARRAARLNRSEEHTSELQSRENLVCRLLLEKKKQET